MPKDFASLDAAGQGTICAFVSFVDMPRLADYHYRRPQAAAEPDGSAPLTAIDWSERKEKRNASSRMFRMLCGGAPARTAVFLPGADCLCVREALDMGVIGRRTLVVAAERDEATFSAMRETLRSMGFARRPVCLGGFIQRFGGDELPKTIDFAYLDLCGHIDGDMALWLEQEMAPRLAPGSVLAMTYACDGMHRSNEIMKRSRVHLADMPPHAVERTQAAVPVVGKRSEMRLDEALGLTLLLCTLRKWRMNAAVMPPYADGRRRMSLAITRVIEASREPDLPGVADIVAATDWLDFSQRVGAEGRMRISAAMKARAAANRERVAEVARIDAEIDALRSQIASLSRKREETWLEGGRGMVARTGSPEGRNT